MVWESEDWKLPLLKLAKRLKTLKASKDLSDNQIAQVERDVLIGFYSVRRLIETPTKLTDKTSNLFLSVRKYANVKPVTWRNNHKLDELYDLSRSSEESRDVMFVCGRIIHSVVLAPCQSADGGLCGVFFTSDRDKDRRLSFITIDQVISLFSEVGNDSPCHIESSRDLVTGKETLVAPQALLDRMTERGLA
jgi:hypothetical protein